MVDDPITNLIVSWSSTNSSFVVWNLPEFARDLLQLWASLGPPFKNLVPNKLVQNNPVQTRVLDSEKKMMLQTDDPRENMQKGKIIYGSSSI
ncbi:hypothetical protein ACFX2A_004689 [Malus domestica]